MRFLKMIGIWDREADSIKKGDKLRDVSPVKTYNDENGITHYIFNKILFNNPYYVIPDDDLELFNNFLDGGSRTYPSDGSIPCDIVAGEARKILNRIVAISNDSNEIYYKEASGCLEEGKLSLVRGTLKLYLGKYTTRDWRRKRFTDDIDFWVFKVHLLDHVLRKLGWIKNNESGEWEKQIEWVNPDTDESRTAVLCAANNLNQLMDFGAGSYLEGTKLKEIFNKKIRRGHDVDLSDIINVALYSPMENSEEWSDAWEAFVEAANTRNTRTTSNLISLCRYSLAISDHTKRLAKSLEKYHKRIYDKSEYPDNVISRICRNSIHWKKYLKENGFGKTRELIHEFLLGQIEEKLNQSKNLKKFAHNILQLLNSKYAYQNVEFEIEDQ